MTGTDAEATIIVVSALKAWVLMALRIIVADDNPRFLDKLISVLGAEFEIVATAGDGKTVLECIRDWRPDVVVLDLEMPELNALDISKELGKYSGSPAVVICSVESDPEIVQEAEKAGALGYVYKTRIDKDLILAVKSVASGRRFVSPL